MLVKFKRGFAQIRSYCKLVGMKDKALIILLAILLGQSTYVLFTGDAGNTNAASIDLVIRTTAAAIFGYFLSANFLTKNSTSSKNCSAQDAQIMRIMSTSEKNEEAKENEMIDETRDSKHQVVRESNNYCSAQTFIATIIAIYALIVLIIARDLIGQSTTSIAALSQFRDFVSGCVGFLVGTPINRGRK